MNPSDFRKLLDIIEARNPDLEYQETEKQVIAKLKSYNSQSYTKLANKLERISVLESEIKQLKEEVKTSTKLDVADLFDAEDAVKTRVIETISVVITLSKDPVPTVSPKYKEILEALSTHLTPELITVLEGLKKQMVTVTQKSPGLKVEPAEESVMEGLADKLSSMMARFRDIVFNWAKTYDSKLAQLKSQM